MNVEECSICLENIEGDSPSNEVCKLTCGHSFHTNCLKKIYRCACPLCNAEITGPDEVYASIQNNIVMKRFEEMREEQNYIDSEMIGFQNFINIVLINVCSEKLSGETTHRKRYPLYYRYQSNWSWSYQVAQYLIACSELYQSDESEGITWSYDLTVERTVSEYTETNDLVLTAKYVISDLLETLSNSIEEIVPHEFYAEYVS